MDYVDGLGGRNRTSVTWSQTTNSTIKLHREKTGAPGVNRTPDLGLQNRCFTTITNGANFLAPHQGIEPCYPLINSQAHAPCSGSAE